MKVITLTVMLSVLTLVSSANSVLAEPSPIEKLDVPTKLTPQKFAGFHTLIKPQRGESRWMEINWHPRVWKARRKAAAEGKPLFFMAGSGGAPAAGC
mgnify:FL=1